MHNRRKLVTLTAAEGLRILALNQHKHSLDIYLGNDAALK